MNTDNVDMYNKQMVARNRAIQLLQTPVGNYINGIRYGYSIIGNIL